MCSNLENSSRFYRKSEGSLKLPVGLSSFYGRWLTSIRMFHIIRRIKFSMFWGRWKIIWKQGFALARIELVAVLSLKLERPFLKKLGEILIMKNKLGICRKLGFFILSWELEINLKCFLSCISIEKLFHAQLDLQIAGKFTLDFKVSRSSSIENLHGPCTDSQSHNDHGLIEPRTHIKRVQPLLESHNKC